MKVEFVRDRGPGARGPEKRCAASVVRNRLSAVPGPRSPVPSLSVEASP